MQPNRAGGSERWWRAGHAREIQQLPRQHVDDAVLSQAMVREGCDALAYRHAYPRPAGVGGHALQSELLFNPLRAFGDVDV